MIKVIAMDVDGVLTDGNFYWGPNGEEFKVFSFRDVMGISNALKEGIVIVLISGESSPLIDRYAKKMGIVDIYKGCKDKASALTEVSNKYSVEFSEICYIGDDINDVPALELAGIKAVPSDAHPDVLSKATFISIYPGGNGAVREILDKILSKK